VGDAMRFLLLAVSLVSAQGCVGYSQLRADRIHAQVSGEDVKAGRNSHLRIGMPIGEAEEHLKGLGFHLDRRPREDSSLGGVGEFTLRYVKSLPHPTPLVDFQHEVHVLLSHDGDHLTDYKSETICTTVD
jgi:hypothetical protein